MALGKSSEKKPLPPPKQDTSKQALQILEDKIANLNRKSEVIENNILKVNQRQNAELKSLNAKNLELEKEIGVLKKIITQMASDMKHFARTERVQTLQKYLDLWNPISFATHTEVEEVVEEKLRELRR